MPVGPFRDLPEFVQFLESAGELVEVKAPVDPRLEVAEIHRRVIAAGGPALLFRNVKGSRYPVVTNLFGTRRRAQAAFGSHVFQTIDRIVQLLQDFEPSLSTLWRNRDLFFPLFRLGTTERKAGAVTEHVLKGGGLEELPVLTCWPEDGGPFLTLPLVYTVDPLKQTSNLGIYRMQVFNGKEAGMHWQIGKGGGFHYSTAERENRALPVTVFLGGPPALMLSAIAPLPEGVPELLLASLIAGRKLEVTSGLGPHPLLSSAEFALCGEVRPGVRRPEGPFGDHYGYYSLVHDYPVFELDRLYHRKDAMFPATVVGKPRQEDFFIGDLLQELLQPVFPMVMPGVEDIWAYGETGYHSLAAAVVRQRYRREAMANAFRILGEGQLSLTKFLLVTDQAVDLKDFPKTLAHLLERTDPQTDLYVFSNLSMDTLDYTGPRINEGSKGIWLGLGNPRRALPQSFSATDLPPQVSGVKVFCPGCLVIGGPAYESDPGFAQVLVEHAAFSAWPLLILTDEPERASASAINFLWTTFTRFEPAADLYARSTTVTRHHLGYELPLLIDARMKPPYPKELTCSPDISRLVSQRWREYFPLGVEMGDSEAAHLDRV